MESVRRDINEILFELTTSKDGSVRQAADRLEALVHHDVELQKAKKRIQELERLLIRRPGPRYDDENGRLSMSTNDVLAFLDRWHDWAKEVQAALGR